MKTDLEDLFKLPKLDFLENALQEQEQILESIIEDNKNNPIDFSELEPVDLEYKFAELEPVEFPTLELNWAKFEPAELNIKFEPIDWAKFS